MNTYNFLPEIGNLVFLQQLFKSYGFLGNNGTGKCGFLSRKTRFFLMSFIAINFGALNNLLQMFSNNVNLNGNKPSLLPPPQGPGTSTNMNLSSQNGSTQSLNVQDQQHTLSSPRAPAANANNGTYSNETSLLMCGAGPYNNGGPNPNNAAGPPATHHNQNGALTPSVATSGTNPYTTAMPSLYTNTGNPLTNGGAGREFQLI